MPIETSLPFPSPQQNLKWGWPNISTVPNSTTQGMNLTGYQTQGNGSAINVWGVQLVTGTNLMIMFNRVLGANFNNETSRPIVPYPYIIDDNSNIGAGAPVPEQYRYYRIVLWLAQNGDVDVTGAFQFSPASVSAAGYSQLGLAAFGFTCDGAGGWDYVTSDIGAFPANLLESIPIVGITGSDWNAFEFEFVGATASANAVANMSVNGILIASRAWQGGGILLPLISVVANGNKILGGVRANDAVNDLIVGPMFIEQGRFTKAGLELAGV